MEPENFQRGIEKILTRKDEQITQLRVIDELIEGNKSNNKELATQLRKELPWVSPELVKQITEGEDFATKLLKSHIVRTLCEMRSIFDVLIEKAKGGNDKLMRLYFELLGVIKKNVTIQQGVQNNITLKGLSDKDLYEQYTEIADSMD